MATVDILKKLRLYKTNPSLVQEMTPNEIADIALLIMSQVNLIEKAIKEGRLDGYTPQPDKDYVSRETMLRMLGDAVNDVLRRVDSELGTKGSQLDKAVSEAISRLRDGKDGIITDEEIERAATVAFEMLELPDFDAKMVECVQSNGALIRDALESLPEGEEQMSIEAVRNLRKELNDLRDSIIMSSKGGGGVSKATVLQLIAENGGGGGATTFLDLTDTPSSYAGQAGKVPVVNVGETALEFVAPTGTGTVTSVAISGSDGIEVDSGSPITAAGTIALGLNKITTLTFLNVEDGAEVNNISDVNATDLTDGGETTLHTHAASGITSGTFNNDRIAQSNVTQHQGAIDHGSIAGLSDDDHTQYLLLTGNGTRNSVTSATLATDDAVLIQDTSATGALRKVVPSEIAETLGASSTTFAGRVELATDAETVTGTDTARATTPANITARLAAPGAIGGTTPGAITATTVTTTGNIELGNASDTTVSRVSAGVIAVEGVTVPTISSTNTFTNKRITKRITSETSSATPTINTDNCDVHRITALAANVTSMTTNLSGTPTSIQVLGIEVTPTATRTVTWGSSFESSAEFTLPTEFTGTDTGLYLFYWNTITSKWRYGGKI